MVAQAPYGRCSLFEKENTCIEQHLANGALPCSQPNQFWLAASSGCAVRFLQFCILEFLSRSYHKWGIPPPIPLTTIADLQDHSCVTLWQAPTASLHPAGGLHIYAPPLRFFHSLLCFASSFAKYIATLFTLESRWVASLTPYPLCLSLSIQPFPVQNLTATTSQPLVRIPGLSRSILPHLLQQPNSLSEISVLTNL